MKIQLIHPPVYINKSGLTALRPSLPMGLAYIAAVLVDDGHQVSVVDALGLAPEKMTPEGDIWRLGLSPDEIVERIEPDVGAIGVTNMWSYSWPIVRELIHKLKERYPHVPIVCGGEHFTAVAEHSMAEAPIDYIVLGEGEETAISLFRALEKDMDVSELPGICHRGADANPHLPVDQSDAAGEPHHPDPSRRNTTLFCDSHSKPTVQSSLGGPPTGR